MLAIVVGGIGAAPARAQDAPSIFDEQDAQLWIQFNSQVPVSPRWTLVFEAQPRWNQNFTHFDQAVFRTGGVTRLSSAVQLGAAYAFIPRNTVIGLVYEHQSYQQVQFRLPRLGTWTPQVRVRQDQRYLPAWGDASHRTRQQVRVTRPLPRRPDVTLVLYEESFVNLDDTVRGPARGIDQFRMYSGLQRPITKDLSVELGYMWQEVFELGARPHRRNHNAMLQFQFRPRGGGGRAPAPMPRPMQAPASASEHAS